jgi:large-conductance mechanosensitive channel
MKFYKTFLFFGFLTFQLALNAAHSSLKLSPKQWQEVSEGVDYTETYKDLEQETKASNSIKWNPFDYDFSNLKYVFYFLVSALIVFLLIKIILSFKTNPSIKPKTISIDSIEEIEEKMHELDMDLLLKEALQAKNYRIALRINFLIIIKMLSQKGDIVWAKEKTNWEYYSEVKDINLSALFKEIIISFEPVWYGEHQLTEEQFNLVSPTYENLKKQLALHE